MSVSLSLLLILLNTLQYRVMLFDYPMEIFIGVVAILFMLLGIWMANKLSLKPENDQLEKANSALPISSNFEGTDNMGLTQREMEVLHLMALGLSNHEIADKLCVSLPTVKTHSSNLYEKLGVKRRTQAVIQAKSLKIIP